MKIYRLLAVVVSLGVLVLGATMSVSAGEILLENNFTKWTNVTNRNIWHLEDNYAEHKFSDGVVLSTLFCGAKDWTDYSFEVRFKVTRYGEFGQFRLFVRSDSLWYGYGWGLHNYGTTLHRFEGNWDLSEVLFNAEPESLIFEEGTEYVVRMDVRGNEVQLFVDGELVATAVDDLDFWPAGGVGIKASNVEVEIYSARVVEL